MIPTNKHKHINSNTHTLDARMTTFEKTEGDLIIKCL